MRASPLPAKGRQRGQAAICGVLNVAKPEGMTSFAVIRAARLALGERQIGHAGTLDPAASGVLPLCVGPATRLVEYILRQSKTYHARLRLGEVSDTGDLEGEVHRSGSAAGVTQEQVARELASFVGIIEQVPPMHSAVRHQGRHLYELARQGVEVERKAKSVEIKEIALTAFRSGEIAEAEVEVVCGRGTYLRVLATDLGERLGCGGVLAWLERTQYGPFDLADAITVEQLASAPEPRRLLLPAEIAVPNLPRVDLLPGPAASVSRGQAVWLQRAPEQSGEVRAHGPDGRLIAVGEVKGLRFRPTKVLLPAFG